MDLSDNDDTKDISKLIFDKRIYSICVTFYILIHTIVFSLLWKRELRQILVMDDRLHHPPSLLYLSLLLTLS